MRWWRVGALVLVACGGAESAGGDAAPDGDAQVADARVDAGDSPGQDSDPGDEGVGSVEGGTLVALKTCAPSAEACAALSVDTTLRASYRKDAFLPDAIYPEYTDDPLAGGRFHIAATAQVSGAVTGVFIDGVAVETLLAPPSARIEWYHVWPQTAVAGQPLWVAFHSRDPAWDAATQGSLRVETAAGVAVDGPFPVAQTPAPLTWVTTSADRGTLLIHVRNDDTVSQRLQALWVNGRDVLAGGVACVADPELAAGQAALWTVPLCVPAQPGEAWTVAAQWADAPDSVGVGRVLRPHFPVEAWGNSSDCAAPGADDAAWQAHLDAGFDTFYFYWGASAECGYQTSALVNQTLPRSGEGFVLIGDDFLRGPDPASAITDTRAVAGFLTGDESDGELYDDEGRPNAEKQARDARTLWSMYPELTVYNGAKTHGNVGTFAGMADVQGHDAYLGACAPHITKSGVFRPARTPHDFLRNARDNHMPLPTWFYAQGLFQGWNLGPSNNVTHQQPDPQEILVQAMMVLTAGGKGLMWFLTDQAEAAFAPERWQAISRSNWMIRAVRELVREGDVTGAARASTGEDVLVEAIRARDAIVVPVIALASDDAPDDLRCFTWPLEEDAPPHWIFSSQSPDIALPVPADMALAEVFEVSLEGKLQDARWRLDPATRELTLPAVALSNDVPVRLFVLAASPDVRARMSQALADHR